MNDSTSRMYRLAAMLASLLLCVVCAPPATAQRTLSVSEDGRHFVGADGEAFFWLGDTAWELFHRLDREEADRYLEDRARKGFNVIQAVVLAELDGLRVPNPYGETPLIGHDPTRPNEAYFEHVDYIVDKAASLGMVIGMLPTWGDKFNQRWGVGPEVFTPDNAQAFGEYIGARYADDAIIWILGGDRPIDEPEHAVIVRAMAEGISEGDGGAHLMTYHPNGQRRSWDWFQNDAWLDFNFFQSSHGIAVNANYEHTAEGYALEPVRPVLDGEPPYEDHPIDWDPEQGWFDAFDARRAGYWSVLSGAAGHTYGNHNIWQMWEPGRDPISSARTPWNEALTHPGSAHVGFMKDLFLSRPFLPLVPDQSVVSGSSYDDARHVRAARDDDGRYLIAYTPYGWPVEIDLDVLSGETARAWWFDPRTGATSEIGTFQSEGSRTFDPPGPGDRGNDWVLVVDDASEAFDAPGRRE